MSNRMQLFGRPPGAPYGGSRVKKVRLRIANPNDNISLEVKLALEWVPSDAPRRRRVATVDLKYVTAEHVWNAVQHLIEYPHELLPNDVSEFNAIINSNVRLPPRSIVSLAVSEALGLKVGTYDVPCDTEMLCHKILKDAGFTILQRGDSVPSEPIPISDDDRVWVEGGQALLVHLQRERAAGLSRAKKQSFVRLHGALRCENCGLDPVAIFGPEVGHACIEVHHSRTRIREMAEGHRTMLSDLQCLCANCHRIVHARLRRELS
ncbi:HNH endonuclease [Pinisolibacter sp. B13]|nr:HNH endonuclease [Pinisolibacter aquiterrae]